MKTSFNDNSRKSFIETKKHLVILTDIDPTQNALEFLAVNLLFLANFNTTIENQIQNLLSTELSNLPKDLFSNFQKPILLNCGEVDAYYDSL